MGLELSKLYRRPLGYLALGAVFIIDLVVFAAAALEGQRFLDFFTENLQETFFFKGELLNGSLVSYLILNSLWFHIPLIVVVVACALVGGEGKDGSLQTVLTRSVSRSAYVVSKYLLVILVSSVLVVLLALTSLGLSYGIFGDGDLLVLMDTLNIIPFQEALLRLLAAFAFGVLAMVTVGIMAATISLFFDSPVNAILVSIFSMILLTIIGKGSPSSFWLSKLLFVYHLSGWQHLFQFEIVWQEVLISSIVLIAYSLGFICLGIWYFRKKDILV